MKKINSSNTRKYSRHMADKYGVYIMTNSGPTARIIEAVLDLIGVSAVEDIVNDWMQRWAITFRRVIYLPFTPGVACDRFPLWLQVQIIGHEFQHIIEQRRGRRWFLRYLFRPWFRAQEEATAFKAQMEIANMFGREISPAKCQDILRKSYLLGKTNSYIAYRVLKKHEKYVNRGYITTESAKETRKFWV